MVQVFHAILIRSSMYSPVLKTKHMVHQVFKYFLKRCLGFGGSKYLLRRYFSPFGGPSGWSMFEYVT